MGILHADMSIHPSTSVQAEDDARAALEYDPCFVKAYVRAAKACDGLEMPRDITIVLIILVTILLTIVLTILLPRRATASGGGTRPWQRCVRLSRSSRPTRRCVVKGMC